MFRDRLVDGIVPGPEPLPDSRSHGISARMSRRSDSPDLRCPRWLLPSSATRGVTRALDA